MCIGGEFLCLKSELKEIPVGYSALNQKSDVWYENERKIFEKQGSSKNHYDTNIYFCSLNYKDHVLSMYFSGNCNCL